MRDPNPIVCKLLHLVIVEHTAMGKPDVWPLPLNTPTEHTILAQHDCGVQHIVWPGYTCDCHVQHEQRNMHQTFAEAEPE